MNEYYQIAETLGRVFGAEDKPTLAPDGTKNTVFTIVFRTNDGVDMRARLTGERYSWKLHMPRAMFESLPFDRFISKLEFELEQTFKRNIKLDTEDEVSGFVVRLDL